VKLEANTNDQKWFEMIYGEVRALRNAQDRTNSLLARIAGEGDFSAVGGGETAELDVVRCECGREFSGPQKERALRAHRRVHDKGVKA
jgi:hypothetical protein